MKKKTNLTEKQLAIGMWLYIKEYIKSHDDAVIAMVKYMYLKEHMIGMASAWPNLCILCHKYSKDCSKCPLGSCSSEHNTLWSVVTNWVYNANVGKYESPFTLQERLDACDKIIEAIEKDVPDDYVSPPHYL